MINHNKTTKNANVFQKYMKYTHIYKIHQSQNYFHRINAMVLLKNLDNDKSHEHKLASFHLIQN